MALGFVVLRFNPPVSLESSLSHAKSSLGGNHEVKSISKSVVRLYSIVSADTHWLLVAPSSIASSLRHSGLPIVLIYRLPLRNGVPARLC